MGGILTVSKDILGCYVITPDTVRTLYAHIAEARDQPPEATFEFSDGRNISGKGLEDILSDSIVASAKLERIRISSPQTNRPSVELILKSDGNAGSYRVHGERDMAVGLADTINNDLLAAKALYSRLSVHEYRSPSPSTVALGFLAVMGMLILGGIWAGDRVVGIVSARTYYATIAFILLAIPTYFFLFPALVFSIGHGAKRFSLRKTVAGILFIGVLLSFVVAIGANFATDAIKVR
jgi:hypothetical protein